MVEALDRDRACVALGTLDALDVLALVDVRDTWGGGRRVEEILDMAAGRQRENSEGNMEVYHVFMMSDLISEEGDASRSTRS